jgi:AcrR family transcriptional regulator
MQIPLRILRAYAEDLPNGRPKLSAREMDREDKILAAAQMFMVRFGRSALTMGTFAASLHMATGTIRKHFADLDAMLAEILIRHLAAIANAIGEVPYNAPNLHAARRAAYLGATRTAFNAPTDRHLLLLRDRHSLPQDLAETVENLRNGIGDMVAGPNGATALALLDMPDLQAPEIEAMLAALTTPAAPAALKPATRSQNIRILPPLPEKRPSNAPPRKHRPGKPPRAGPH